MNDLTPAQAEILDTVQRNGPTVFSGLQRRPAYALEALGLVTVKVNYLWDRKRGRGFKSYTVAATEETS